MNRIESTRTAWMWVLVLLLGFACAGQAAAQAWTQLAPSGTAPSARYEHAAVYDAAGNRMIVFGGYNGSSDVNETWVLGNANGSGGTPAWTLLTPSGAAPLARAYHTAVYDDAGNHMIVYGGYNAGALNDVWVLGNANGSGGTPAWTLLAPSGSGPSARYYHTAVYDTAGNRMIVFGGAYNGSFFNDVWVLSNANGSGGTPAWTQLMPSGTAPSARFAHKAVYDAAGNRMLVYGGCGNSACPTNEVWVLSNANGSGGTPTWTQLAPSGTTPSARLAHTAVYDGAGNRMIVFGGYDGYFLFNDVWVLSNANGSGGTPAWTQLAPSGSAPSARYNLTAVFASGRMIVFDGCWSGGCPGNDVWVLSGVGSATTVAIDIRPRLAINPISRTTGTTVPVAILSSANFNALTAVNRTSLTFGHTGTEASLIHCNTLGQDVNADGRMDLVCQFNGTLGGFQMGDSTGYLTGTTLQGGAINGSDSVLILQ